MAYFTKYVCFYKLDDKSIVMLNTLTGAIDIIDNATYSAIGEMINCQEIKKDCQIYNVLKNRGYIFENENEEVKIKDKQRNKLAVKFKSYQY